MACLTRKTRYLSRTDHIQRKTLFTSCVLLNLITDSSRFSWVMFGWQTAHTRAKILRTRMIDRESLRNLFYLLRRTNVLDSSRIKRRRKEWGLSLPHSLARCVCLTITALIAFEHRCERDPLPWQDAVTRSVAANESAIKGACSHFRRQNLRSCARIWSWYRRKDEEE